MLARSGTPEALAEALEPLLLSSDRRAAIARAGRERFVEDLTDVAMQDRHFEVFEAMRSRAR
jgi:hypothetical protein